jgi:hypothetical protein
VIVLAEADDGAIVGSPILLLHLDDEVAQIVEADLAGEGGLVGAVVVGLERGNDQAARDRPRSAGRLHRGRARRSSRGTDWR